MDVIKTFIDKETEERFTVGSTYNSEDWERIRELQRKGFLGAGEVQDGVPSGVTSVESILDQNVNEIIELILKETDQDTLKILLDAEISGKNRSTVIKHIESLLKGDDEDGPVEA